MPQTGSYVHGLSDGRGSGFLILPKTTEMAYAFEPRDKRQRNTAENRAKVQ